jgi:outer membrane protein assembly factor BamB
MMRIGLAYWLLLGIFVTPAIAEPVAEEWPGWRGPRGDGTSRETLPIPTKWNGMTGENIAWKVAVPGKGHSSPVVYGNHVFLTSCLEDRESRVLLAFDRRSGKQLWMQEILKAPLEKKHDLNSFASSTPAIDGQRVYVTFLVPEFASTQERTPGEMVVAAYDFDGQQKWRVKPGRFASVHGFCSSPVIFEDLLIVNGDHDGDSYIVALNKETGEQVWKIPRENQTRSYVTPIIRDIDGRTQMVLSGSKMVTSYNPRSGEKYWHMRGPTEQFVASLVENDKYLFLTAGFPDYHILCIDPRGSGDVTDTHIVWRTQKACSYVPSPVICRHLEGDETIDYFVIVSDGGIGTCYLADTGKVLWQKRLGPHYSASLLTAGELVFCTADDGVTKVIRPGDELEVVAENPLGQNVYASAAKSRGQLFIRGEKELFCIGSE